MKQIAKELNKQAKEICPDTLPDNKWRADEIKKLENFISCWNGTDDKFTFEGEVYTEQDVIEAEDRIIELNK